MRLPIHICILALCTMLSGTALAHEWPMPNGQVADAGWIEKHHNTCCGRKDCFPDRKVTLTSKGWKVEGAGGFIHEDQVKPSRDGQVWACINLKHNLVRCLFMPGAGV